MTDSQPPIADSQSPAAPRQMAPVAEQLPVLMSGVDYGDERGGIAVQVPHAWRQDVPVAWEGAGLGSLMLRLAWMPLARAESTRIDGVENGGVTPLPSRSTLRFPRMNDPR